MVAASTLLAVSEGLPLAHGGGVVVLVGGVCPPHPVPSALAAHDACRQVAEDDERRNHSPGGGLAARRHQEGVHQAG